jgi:hypothetical protein
MLNFPRHLIQIQKQDLLNVKGVIINYNLAGVFLSDVSIDIELLNNVNELSKNKIISFGDCPRSD